MLTVGEVLTAAAPVFERMLTDDERSRLRSRVADAGRLDEPVDEADAVREGMLIDYSVGDDSGSTWLWPPEDAAQFATRFASELQDFIAESGFGCGELRE